MEYKEILKSLNEQMAYHSQQIAKIDLAISAVNNLLGVESSQDKLNGRLKNRSGKVYGEIILKKGRKTKQDAPPQVDKLFKSNEHDLVITSGMSPAEKQKIYAARCRAKKLALNGKSTSVPQFAGDPNRIANKFSLNREFNIDNKKDLDLMMSYLVSWKGTGKLSEDEIRGLTFFEGRVPMNLVSAERMTLRQIFYGARDRVMTKTKTVSHL